MNWDDVRMFLAVARTGQILAASRRLGSTTPPCRGGVTAIEDALKTKLFVRRTHGCELTSEGESFLAFAERMESEMLAAQALIGKIDTTLAAPCGSGRRTASACPSSPPGSDG